MKEIGITGGIGSGKTTVARIFESMGYAVYFADARAKALYVEDAEVKAAVIALFGADIYLKTGEIDRKKLAGIVFQDKEKLQALNAIVHPATGRDFANWLAELEGAGYDKAFVLKEAAILFEAKAHERLHGVIEVYAPKSIRVDRVCKRDGVEPAQVLARMGKQFPELYKLRNADFVIYSDGVHHLIPQVQQAVHYFSQSLL